LLLIPFTETVIVTGERLQEVCSREKADAANEKLIPFGTLRDMFEDTGTVTGSIPFSVISLMLGLNLGCVTLQEILFFDFKYVLFL